MIYINNPHYFVCNNCKKIKTNKMYNSNITKYITYDLKI